MHDVFYFTDIHGRKELYDRIISFCEQQDPEYTIIFGGDACDRGPDGYAIMQDMLNNPHIVYLKGNHEELFVKAARALLTHYTKRSIYIHNITTPQEAEEAILAVASQDANINLYLINGGLSTLTSWILDRAKEEFIQTIDQLPICFKYNEYDFCHAGGAPRAFEEVYVAEYNHEVPSAYSIKTCLWDRDCFNLAWTPERICVHGHTPAIFLPQQFYNFMPGDDEKNMHPAAWIGKMKEENTGLKINMDTGAAFTGIIYVLNILTKKLYRFDSTANSTIKEYEFVKGSKYGENTYSVHYVRPLRMRKNHLGA